MKSTFDLKEATMTIVVTGATGNVGRPLVTLLAAAGCAGAGCHPHTATTAGFPTACRR